MTLNEQDKMLAILQDEYNMCMELFHHSLDTNDKEQANMYWIRAYQTELVAKKLFGNIAQLYDKYLDTLCNY